jgi:hypothetical protein
VNRVKVGFFSLSRRSPDGDDRSYLAWHQLDHMPEQYQLPALVLGQRWMSTPACRAARAVENGQWSEVEHVVCYLMGEPVERTIDDFYALGGSLAAAGRFPRSLPSSYRGGLGLVETRAAARALISPEVVPFRPHRGIYLIVETHPDGRAEADPGRAPGHDRLGELVAVPGVAGAWRYASSATSRHPRFSEGNVEMTVCYLDDDPATVAKRLGPVMSRAAAERPTRLELAAPFASMMAWDLDQFDGSLA